MTSDSSTAMTMQATKGRNVNESISFEGVSKKNAGHTKRLCEPQTFAEENSLTWLKQRHLKACWSVTPSKRVYGEKFNVLETGYFGVAFKNWCNNNMHTRTIEKADSKESYLRPWTCRCKKLQENIFSWLHYSR